LSRPAVASSSALPLVWKRAALLGSAWASIEIVLGSFLHNLRVPFAGTILCLISITLLVAAHSLWHHRGVLWRGAFVCALMKSISPSAVILGPMIGIVSEGIILEIILFPFGGNAVAYLVGGGIVSLLPLVQLAVSQLLQFGFDIVRLYTSIYSSVAGQLGIAAFSAGHALATFAMIVFVLGMIAAWGGLTVGRRVLAESARPAGPAHQASPTLFDAPSDRARFSRLVLLAHLILLYPILVALRSLDLWGATLLTLAYALVVLLRYPLLKRRILRPGIWLQFSLIALASGVFLGSTGGWTWSGALVGVRMVLRAVYITLFFSAVSVELRNPVVLQYFLRAGLGRLADALKVAFGALPTSLALLSEQKRALLHPVQSGTRMLASVVATLDDHALPQTAKVFLVTGGQGEGKTHFLEDLAAVLSERNIAVRGFVAPVVYHNNVRVGYDLVDLETKQRATLCRVGEGAAAMQQGPFQFDSAVLKLGADALSSAAGMQTVVIVDEIGPLELKGNGWAALLREQLQSSGTIIIAVRRQLVEDVQRHFGFSALKVWNAGLDNPQDAGRILAETITAGAGVR
jgi:nucleoside-triphosphatase THEP1